MTHQTPLSLSDLDDHELGQHLTMLGAELDLGDVDLVGLVSSAIELEPVTNRFPIWRRRPLLAAAAVIVVIVGSLVIVTPTRAAIAGWLGIGSTSVEIIEELPPATSPPIPSAAPPGSDMSVEAIERASEAAFDQAVGSPDQSVVGPPIGWEIRDLGEARELVIAWDDFTLSARPDAVGFRVTKATTSAELVSFVSLADGTSAMWIEGPHVRIVLGQAERAESTLLWVRDGMEYRLSGKLDQTEAIALADTSQAIEGTDLSFTE